MAPFGLVQYVFLLCALYGGTCVAFEKLIAEAGEKFLSFAGKLLSGGFMDHAGSSEGEEKEKGDFSFSDILSLVDGDLFGGALTLLSKVITFFTPTSPKGPSPELIKLKEGFKTLGERFDDVDAAIETVESKIDKVLMIQVAQQYRQERAQIGGLRRGLEALIKWPNDSQARHQFHKECSIKSTSSLLIWFKEHAGISLPGSQGLIMNLFDCMEYDLNSTKLWFSMILSDLASLTILHPACIGITASEKGLVWSGYLADSPAFHSYIESEVNWTKGVFETVVKKMAEAEKKLKLEFYKHANNESLERLKTWKNMSDEVFANSLFNHFKAKYFWVHWAVVAYVSAIKDDTWHKSRGIDIHVRRIHGTNRSVYVTWCRPDSLNGSVDIAELGRLVDKEGQCTKKKCPGDGVGIDMQLDYFEKRLPTDGCPAVIGKASSKFFFKVDHKLAMHSNERGAGCLVASSLEEQRLCGTGWYDYVLAYRQGVSLGDTIL